MRPMVSNSAVSYTQDVYLCDVFEVLSTGSAWFFHFSANGASSSGLSVNLSESVPNLPSFNRYCGIFSLYTVV